jgi:hypothetical protein
MSSSVRPIVSTAGDAWAARFDAATDIVAWVDRERRYIPGPENLRQSPARS